jgi:hypothetical protein
MSVALTAVSATRAIRAALKQRVTQAEKLGGHCEDPAGDAPGWEAAAAAFAPAAAAATAAATAALPLLAQPLAAAAGSTAALCPLPTRM